MGILPTLLKHLHLLTYSGDEGWTTFRIMASTIGGMFESYHEEGYSVDNIAPELQMVLAMVLEDGIEFLESKC